MFKQAASFIFILLFTSFYQVKTSAQEHTVGVLQFDKAATEDGYIFFSPQSNTSAYLIDNCGHLINTWKRNNRPGLSGYLAPNGLMLRTNKVNNPAYSQASTGGNIELVDWDNNTVWSSDFNQFEFIQHHDAILMPNGNILYIGWERISPEEQIAYGRNPNAVSLPYLWGEFIQEIKPIGSSEYEIIWEWHLQDHFVQDFDPSRNNFGVIKDEIGKVDINYLGPGAWDDDDWWHCNALDYNPSLDQILVNSRNNNELWIIDHSTTIEEAKGSTGGNSGKGGALLYRWGNPEAYDSGTSANLRMYGSHGHYWIPNGYPNSGKIMYFNNGDERPEGYYSTVEMLDPIPENGSYKISPSNIYYPLEPEIVYRAPDPFEFVSFYLSNAQQLPNGNVFINEGGSGRLFEIDPNGNIVWEYINPVNFIGPNPQGTIMFGNANFRAYKYTPGYTGLEGQPITPGELLEGDSEYNFCQEVATHLPVREDKLKITYDMGHGTLHLTNNMDDPLICQIYMLQGSLIHEAHVPLGTSTLSMNTMNPGIYLAHFVHNKLGTVSTYKIAKLQ